MMLNAYRKSLAAVFGAAGTWCLAALSDGRVTTMEWVALGIAVATALGVYAVPNAVTRPKAREQGQGAVEVLLIVLLVVVILVLARVIR